MVLLPVPTEGTLDHVSSTLPSDASLSIVVNHNTQQKIVCLPRVLRALEYLKNNHPEYENVRTNQPLR